MRKKTKPSQANCCLPGSGDEPCCKVESMTAVDERGQMVLPKEAREKAGIKAGDKLAVISCCTGTRTACLCLVRANDLQGLVKTFLGPMLKNLAGA